MPTKFLEYTSPIIKHRQTRAGVIEQLIDGLHLLVDNAVDTEVRMLKAYRELSEHLRAEGSNGSSKTRGLYLVWRKSRAKKYKLAGVDTPQWRKRSQDGSSSEFIEQPRRPDLIAAGSVDIKRDVAKLRELTFAMREHRLIRERLILVSRIIEALPIADAHALATPGEGEWLIQIPQEYPTKLMDDFGDRQKLRDTYKRRLLSSHAYLAQLEDRCEETMHEFNMLGGKNNNLLAAWEVANHRSHTLSGVAGPRWHILRKSPRARFKEPLPRKTHISRELLGPSYQRRHEKTLLPLGRKIEKMRDQRQACLKALSRLIRLLPNPRETEHEHVASHRDRHRIRLHGSDQRTDP